MPKIKKIKGSELQESEVKRQQEDSTLEPKKNNQFVDLEIFLNLPTSVIEKNIFEFLRPYEIYYFIENKNIKKREKWAEIAFKAKFSSAPQLDYVGAYLDIKNKLGSNIISKLISAESSNYDIFITRVIGQQILLLEKIVEQDQIEPNDKQKVELVSIDQTFFASEDVINSNLNLRIEYIIGIVLKYCHGNIISKLFHFLDYLTINNILQFNFNKISFCVDMLNAIDNVFGCSDKNNIALAFRQVFPSLHLDEQYQVIFTMFNSNLNKDNFIGLLQSRHANFRLLAVELLSIFVKKYNSLELNDEKRKKIGEEIERSFANKNINGRNIFHLLINLGNVEDVRFFLNFFKLNHLFLSSKESEEMQLALFLAANLSTLDVFLCLKEFLNDDELFIKSLRRDNKLEPCIIKIIYQLHRKYFYEILYDEKISNEIIKSWILIDPSKREAISIHSLLPELVFEEPGQINLELLQAIANKLKGEWYKFIFTPISLKGNVSIFSYILSHCGKKETQKLFRIIPIEIENIDRALTIGMIDCQDELLIIDTLKKLSVDERIELLLKNKLIKESNLTILEYAVEKNINQNIIIEIISQIVNKIKENVLLLINAANDAGKELGINKPLDFEDELICMEELLICLRVAAYFANEVIIDLILKEMSLNMMSAFSKDSGESFFSTLLNEKYFPLFKKYFEKLSEEERLGLILDEENSLLFKAINVGNLEIFEYLFKLIPENKIQYVFKYVKCDDLNIVIVSVLWNQADIYKFLESRYPNFAKESILETNQNNEYYFLLELPVYIGDIDNLNILNTILQVFQDSKIREVMVRQFKSNVNSFITTLKDFSEKNKNEKLFLIRLFSNADIEELLISPDEQGWCAVNILSFWNLDIQVLTYCLDRLSDDVIKSLVSKKAYAEVDNGLVGNVNLFNRSRVLVNNIYHLIIYANSENAMAGYRHLIKLLKERDLYNDVKEMLKNNIINTLQLVVYKNNIFMMSYYLSELKMFFDAKQVESYLIFVLSYNNFNKDSFLPCLKLLIESLIILPHAKLKMLLSTEFTDIPLINHLIEGSQFRTVEMLINTLDQKFKKALVMPTNNNRKPLLFSAIESGNLDILNLLLNNCLGKNFIETKNLIIKTYFKFNKKSYNLIEYATEFGNESTITFLNNLITLNSDSKTHQNRQSLTELETKINHSVNLQDEQPPYEYRENDSGLILPPKLIK